MATVTKAGKAMSHAREIMLMDAWILAIETMQLKLMEDPTCDLAWTDGRYLGYNPDYTMKAPLAEVEWLAAHEGAHVVLLHPWRLKSLRRRFGFTHLQANWVADVVVNQLLAKYPKLKRPEGTVWEPRFKGMSLEEVATVYAAELQAQKAAEEAKRQKEQEQQGQQQEQADAADDDAADGEGDGEAEEGEDGEEGEEEGGEGKGGDDGEATDEDGADADGEGDGADDGTDDDAEGDGEGAGAGIEGGDLEGKDGGPAGDADGGSGEGESAESAGGQGNGQGESETAPDGPQTAAGKDSGEESGKGFGFGGECRDATHEDGTEMTETEMRVAEEAAIRKFVQSARLANTTGEYLDDTLQKLAHEFVDPTVPYHELLAQFVERNAKNDFSRVPPSRRWLNIFNEIKPSLRSNEIPTLVIGNDISGSMDEEKRAEAAGHLSAALEAYQVEAIVILHHNDCIVKVDEYTHDDLPLELEAPLGGGTSFVPVFDWVEEQGLQPSCCIMFTDLDGEFPEVPPSYPVLWVDIDRGCRGREAPFGEVIRVYDYE